MSGDLRGGASCFEDRLAGLSGGKEVKPEVLDYI